MPFRRRTCFSVHLEGGQSRGKSRVPGQCRCRRPRPSRGLNFANTRSTFVAGRLPPSSIPVARRCAPSPRFPPACARAQFSSRRSATSSRTAHDTRRAGTVVRVRAQRSRAGYRRDGRGLRRGLSEADLEARVREVQSRLGRGGGTDMAWTRDLSRDCPPVMGAGVGRARIGRRNRVQLHASARGSTRRPPRIRTARIDMTDPCPRF